MAYSAARRTIASAATRTPASSPSSSRHRFAPAIFDRHQSRPVPNPDRFQTRRTNASGDLFFIENVIPSQRSWALYNQRGKLHLVGASSSTPIYRSTVSFNSKLSSAHALSARLPRPGPTRIHSRHITFYPPETDTEDEISVSTQEPAKRVEKDEDEDYSGPPPNWVNPENLDDTVMIEGCDFEHWLIIMGFPKEPKLSKEEMIQTYVSTVAKVVGSEEEAKKKIYSVSTSLYTGFGVALSREIAHTLKGQPNVNWVLPDSYIDVPSKDYGGDLYQNGEVISRPQFHVPLPEAQRACDSDNKSLDPPLYDFDHETELLEERERIYDQLKATMEAMKRDPCPSETNVSEVSKEETQKLFVKLRDRVVAESKSRESEGTEASDESKAAMTELQQIFSQTREKLARLNKDPDRPESEQNCVGKVNDTTEDPNKHLPDLDQLKEKMKRLRTQSKSTSEDEDAKVKLTTAKKENMRESLSALRDEAKESPVEGSSVGHHVIFDTLKERIQPLKKDSPQSKAKDESDETVKR